MRWRRRSFRRVRGGSAGNVSIGGGAGRGLKGKGSSHVLTAAQAVRVRFGRASSALVARRAYDVKVARDTGGDVVLCVVCSYQCQTTELIDMTRRDLY